MILKERLVRSEKDLESQRQLCQQAINENKQLRSKLINLESEKELIDEKIDNLG